MYAGGYGVGEARLEDFLVSVTFNEPVANPGLSWGAEGRYMFSGGGQPGGLQNPTPNLFP